MTDRSIEGPSPIRRNTTKLPEMLSVQTHTPMTFDSPESPDIVFTTLAPVYMNSISDEEPYGWCECIFNGPKLKKVIHSWAPWTNFPVSVPHPPKTLYCLQDSTISGFGMFATADIRTSDLIMTERPLLVCPVGVPIASVMPYLDNLAAGQIPTKEQLILLGLLEQEKLLQHAFARMTPKAQAAFMSLANSHLEDGSGPLTGIVRTNGFGAKFEDDGDVYTSVYNAISRINHSCLPNAVVRFNRPSFCAEIRAIRSIKAGEEILIAYCTSSDPPAKRQEALKKYGFRCSCRLCTSPALEQLCQSVTFSVCRPYGYTACKCEECKNMTKENHQSMVNESLGWIKQIEEHNLQGLEAYNMWLKALVTGYMKLNMDEEIILWAKKWSAIEQAMGGVPGLLEVIEYISPEFFIKHFGTDN